MFEWLIRVRVLEIFKGEFKVVVILEVHLLHNIEEIVVIGGVGQVLLFEKVKRHEMDCDLNAVL